VTNTTDPRAEELIARARQNYKSTDVPDAARWTLQDAGYDAFVREDLLVEHGVIKPLDQDFGTMTEQFTPRPKAVR
jgi:hypothetical protein